MTTILDRYIAKKFLTILLFATMAFVVIFIVVDLIENLNKFLSNKATLSQSITYYLYYIPYIILLTLPVNMLLASLFSLGSMAQHNELVASLTAGISLYRIVLPILLLGMLVSIIAGVAGETVVPEANRNRWEIWLYEIRNRPKPTTGTSRDLAVQDTGNRQINIKFFNGRKNQANTVNILRVEANRIVERWDAKKMNWHPDSARWKMHDVVHRIFEEDGEKVARYDSVWYQASSAVKPEDLLELEIKPEEMNYVELRSFVDNMLKLGADARKWLVDLNMKISYPFANFIIVLFGAPLASIKRRGGNAIGFALALLISFVYFGFIRTGQVMGHSGTLSPFLAAWLGNIIFLSAGIVMMLVVRK